MLHFVFSLSSSRLEAGRISEAESPEPLKDSPLRICLNKKIAKEAPYNFASGGEINSRGDFKL